LLEIVQTLCRLRLLRLGGKGRVSTDSSKGNTMTKIYYAMDHDTENRATVSGIMAFRSEDLRDYLVNKVPNVYAITSKGADIACLRTHECTAHEAHQRGFI
jgi:hypothetical protein